MTDTPQVPSTDVATTTTAPPAVLTEAGQRWADTWRLAQRVCSTEFVPRSFQNRPEAVMAAILYGDELGLGPMQALRNIHVIEGKVGASPELMRGMVGRAGHKLDVVDYSDTKVTMRGTRKDTGSTATVSWTIQDAERAGLLKIESGKVKARSDRGKVLPWEAYTRAMLTARATSELCRLLFADVIGGLSYTPEELAGPGYDVDEIPNDPLAPQQAPAPKAWESDIEDADVVHDTPQPYGGDAEVGPSEAELDEARAQVDEGFAAAEHRVRAEAEKARTGRAMDEGRLV